MKPYLHNTPFSGLGYSFEFSVCAVCMMNAYIYSSAAMLKVVQKDVYPKKLVSQKH